ncbi:MAG TPA: hypothetical protein VII02_07250 [Gemmatimonadaceae bacterium]
MVHNEPGKAHIETGVPDHVNTVSAVLDGEVVAPDRLPVQQHVEVPGAQAARGSSQRPVDEANRPAPSAIAHANRRGQEAGSSSGLMGE